MYKNDVIPARCAPPEPESRLFNKSCKAHDVLDSRFTLRCPGMTRKGFTLIELLVVVLIIGILSAVALPQYRFAVEKARAMEAISLLKAVKTAEEAYYLANGEYTYDLDALAVTLPANLKYFVQDNIDNDWRNGRFALKHKKYGYYLIYSGDKRISYVGVPSAVFGKLYCNYADASDKKTSEQICRKLSSQIIEDKSWTFYIIN